MPVRSTSLGHALVLAAYLAVAARDPAPAAVRLVATREGAARAAELRRVRAHASAGDALADVAVVVAAPAVVRLDARVDAPSAAVDGGVHARAGAGHAGRTARASDAAAAAVLAVRQDVDTGAGAVGLRQR